MIAQECGRRTLGWSLGILIAGLLAAGPAQAQQQRRSLFGGPQPAAPKSDDNPAAGVPQSIRLDQINVPGVKPTAVPVNATDPIAIVNDQVITRQQLSDECVARRGKEILDTLINRVLIEQALRRAKLEVTAAEIDQEIENVARRFGIGREAWLRTLDKERSDQPRAVRSRHHLPRPGPAQALHRSGDREHQGLAGRLRISVWRQAALPDDHG